MDANAGRELLTTAGRLLDISGLITAAEFYREDEHNGTDSRLGRELLYLIANDEWIRSTTEVVDASRADAVDTTIRFEIDTGLITHEALREEPGRTSRIRLPLLVVPASASTDPLATVTVAQANGDLLAPIPGADIRHQVAAALAEIVENYAVTRWAGLSAAAREGRRAPRADRDQRLVLTAALFRLLSAPVRPQADEGGDEGDNDAGGRASQPAAARSAELLNTPLPAEPGWVPPTASAGAGRLTRAKARLIDLLAPYVTDFTDSVQHPVARTHLTVLTERAVRILGALTGTAIVVVDTDRRGSPAILSVTAPSRALIPVEPEPADGWIRDRLRRTRHAAARLRPRAQLRIDMLLPSASADRRVQVLLPAGVAVDPDRVPDGDAGVRPPLAGLRILSAPPPAAGQLAQLVGEVLVEPDPAVRRCLADLALARADILTETLRTYTVVPENVARTGDAVLEIGENDLRKAQAASTSTLRLVRDALERIAAGEDDGQARDPAAGQARDPAAGQADGQGDGPAEGDPLAALRAAWDGGGWVRRSLLRPTWVQAPNSRLLATRAVAVDSPAQRTAPDYARINVPVDVPDASFGSIARFSCVMSAFLMTVVFFFFLFTRVIHEQASTPSTEVLASALTLFSVIQAGRIELPDRSTLRGLLSAAGTVLIVFSILPTLVLAILLAFNFNGPQPAIWSGIGVAVQAAFWLLLKRGPLAAGARSDKPAARILQTADHPGYARFELLRSQWWRETTASALVLGQPAHCYVVWEHATAGRPQPSLRQVVESSARRVRDRIGRAAGNGADAPGTQDTPDASGQAPAPFPPNILGLLRTSTARQALTFMVFRERPHDWPPLTANRPGLMIIPADPMEQNRLAPIEEATEPVDLYLGIEAPSGFTVLGEHPLLAALGVAADFHVLVRDVQLPVPAPLAGAMRRGLAWARLRLGLPDGETTAFGPFLGELSRRLDPDPRLVELWVRSWGEAELRRVRAREGPQVLAPRRPLLASELDVVPLAPAEQRSGRPWRLLAIQGAARSGIYGDILRAVAKLAPGLGLASVSCAELHGSAVILLIGHQAGGAGAEFAGELGAKVPFTGLTVPVDRWLTSAEIGRQQDNPMLRVHARSTDRPGMLLDVLNALPPALAEVLPGMRGRPEASVLHALLTVGAGSATTARLTLQLPGGREVVSGWNDSREADIQREAMSAAIAAGADRTERAAAAAGMAGIDSPGAAPENTVITVSLIRADDPV